VKISIYIPAYNSEKTLDKCIQSLKEQSLKADEIIVINDGSTDKTATIAKEHKIKVINHKINKGISAARNTALRSCKNKFVAGIDGDAIADKQWLKILANTIKKEKASIVGGKILEKKQNLADKWRISHMKQDWGNKKVINPRYIAGNNFICNKKNLLDLNGYNDTFKTNYEDVDICQRLKENNKNIIYEPEAVVKHEPEENIKSVLDRHWRHMLNDYRLPNTLLNKFLKLGINFYTMLKFWLQDSLSNPEIIPIDISLFFHHTAKDFKFRE